MEMAPPQIGRALVVVVDDRVSHGEREDSTGPLVTELLEEARLVVDGVVVGPGDPVAIRNALNTAVIGGVDLVVTIGGASVGDHDVVKPALAGLGLKLLVESVAMRPGKPTWFGRLADGRRVLGLAGNPASAMVGAELFLRLKILVLGQQLAVL